MWMFVMFSSRFFRSGYCHIIHGDKRTRINHILKRHDKGLLFILLSNENISWKYVNYNLIERFTTSYNLMMT